MAAGVGALGVDGAGNHPDHGIHQFLLRGQQVLVFQCHRGLRGQRFHELDGVAIERHHLAGVGVFAVEQLQHADDFALARGQRHRQHGNGAKARLFAELLGAGEVEPRLGVDVVDHHALTGVGHVGGHVAFHRLARVVEQRQLGHR